MTHYQPTFQQHFHGQMTCSQNPNVHHNAMIMWQIQKPRISWSPPPPSPLIHAEGKYWEKEPSQFLNYPATPHIADCPISALIKTRWTMRQHINTGLNLQKCKMLIAKRERQECSKASKIKPLICHAEEPKQV